MKPALLALQLLCTSMLVLAAAPASAACYAGYDATGRVVRSADAPPATVAEAGRLPDGGRVVLNGDQCGHDVTLAEQVTPTRQPASAPLLTDVHVAAAMGLCAHNCRIHRLPLDLCAHRCDRGG